ncbi:MAG TPA: SMR family transporter [Salinisphaeraceae bacterium]|nr:SMR family transporter [Salinisphaeraceae bacterium]
MGQSDGLQRLGSSVVFFFGLIVSMGGLAYAMRTLPTGTAYAVWVGVGAVLTILYGMVFDGEPVTLLRVLFLAGIVGCVAGLRLVQG